MRARGRRENVQRAPSSAQDLVDALDEDGDLDDPYEAIATSLRSDGCRLPASDEWEVLYRAGSQTVFPWGDDWPVAPLGVTSQPNQWGLEFSGDAYAPEIVAGPSLRGGDGGSAACGGMPDPYVLHTFASAYVPPEDLLEEVPWETLETALFQRILDLAGLR